MWLGNLTDLLADVTLTGQMQELVDEFNKQSGVFGGIVRVPAHVPADIPFPAPRRDSRARAA